MTAGNFIRAHPVPVLYGLMVASLVALLPLPPLLQDQAYHQFADQRELFGVPNFWSVVSNLPFVAVGGSRFAAISSRRDHYRAFCGNISDRLWRVLLCQKQGRTTPARIGADPRASSFAS
jgi:hypothetical protein